MWHAGGLSAGGEGAIPSMMDQSDRYEWSEMAENKWVTGAIILFWLVVSTHLKNIRQIGSFPQVGVNIKNI